MDVFFFVILFGFFQFNGLVLSLRCPWSVIYWDYKSPAFHC